MSTFNIDGLVSGLNTTDIITRLVQVDRAPILRLKSRQTEASGRLQAWQALNTRLLALRDRAHTLSLPATYQAANATVSDATILTASAGTGAANGTYTLTVGRLAAAHQIITAVSAADKDARTYGTGTITVQVGATSTEVVIAETDGSLAGIARAINSARPGVTASLIQADGGYRLMLGATTTGAASQITVTSALEGGTTVLGPFEELQAAADAEITLGTGGSSLAVARASNVVTDLLPGVTLALGRVGGPLTVRIEHDQESIPRAVSAFVGAYNDLIGELAQHTRNDPQGGTRGALLGDGTARRIQRMLPDLALGATAPGAGFPSRLSDLGIRLGRDGRLTVDRTRLDAAVTGGLEDTRAVLVAAAGRFDADLAALTGAGGAVQSAIENARATITGFDKQIAVWEERVEQRRKHYVRMFTALERSLATLRSQGVWLTRQVAQLGKGSES